MAEAIKKIVTCPVCLDVFKEPRMLPCQHTYCSGCLKSCIGRPLIGHIQCPECREKFPVPDNDIKIFKKNFKVNQMIDAYHVTVSAVSQTPSTPTKSLTPRSPESPTGPPSIGGGPECAQHHLIMQWYCPRCANIQCEKCTCEHSLERTGIREAASERIKTMKQLVDQCKSFNDHYKKTLTLESLDGHIHRVEEAVGGEVDTTLSQIREALETRREELMRNLREQLRVQQVMMQQEVDLAQGNAETISQYCSRMEDFIRRASSDEPAGRYATLAMRPADIKKVQDLLKRPPPESLLSSLESIKFTYQKDLIANMIKSIATMGHVSLIVHPPLCHLQGVPVTQEIMEGEHYSWQVVCLDAAQQPVNQLDSVQSKVLVKLVSKETAVVTTTQVRKASGNIFFVTFSAPNCGLYEVRATIAGQPLANSPLDVRVVPSTHRASSFSSTPMPTTQEVILPMPKCVRIISDPVKPGRFSDVAVDRDGRIVVSDLANDRICIFSQAGVKITDFGSRGPKNGQFNEPRCVALDNQGFIYVADCNNHRIQKFDKNGKFLMLFKNPNPDLKYPNGLAVSKDGYIFVAEQYTARVIQYNSKGESMKMLQLGSESQKPIQFASYLALGQNNQLYISDKMQQCVHVVRTDGSYVKRLLEEVGLPRQMKRPMGIALDPQSSTIYVAESEAHLITVCLQQGTSQQFGKKGSSKEELNEPQGLFYLAEKKHLYIADKQNKRIVILQM